MEARDLETVDQLLKLVDKPDLFEYYGLAQDAADDAVEEAIKKRRTWAQGQQSNPKFRNEALWIIKHMSLIRRALVEERGAYRDSVKARGIEKALEKLTVFIEGSLADGLMNPAKEAAILDQAQRIGVPAERALERALAVLSGRSHPRGADPSQVNETFVDYYQILRVHADADEAAIEEAHRSRYREARDLADKGRASEMYSQLDEGWRVLKDPERRAAYDARRREFMLNLERRAAGEDGEFKGFLPPPPRKRRAESDDGDLEPMEVVLTQAARVVHDAPPPRGAPPVQRSTPPRPAPAAEPRPDPRPTLAPPSSGFEVHASSNASSPVPTPPMRAPETQEAIRGSGYSSVGGNRARQRSPQLEIDGPEIHKVRAGDQPIAVQFVVRNSGQGQMSGRVLSDREWVQVTPSRLDPTRAEQLVEAVVYPGQMPRRQAISLVTVVADHGERRSITIDVERKTMSPVTLFAIVAVTIFVLLGIAIAVAM